MDYICLYLNLMRIAHFFIIDDLDSLHKGHHKELFISNDLSLTCLSFQGSYRKRMDLYGTQIFSKVIMLPCGQLDDVSK